VIIVNKRNVISKHRNDGGSGGVTGSSAAASNMAWRQWRQHGAINEMA